MLAAGYSPQVGSHHLGEYISDFKRPFPPYKYLIIPYLDIFMPQNMLIRVLNISYFGVIINLPQKEKKNYKIIAISCLSPISIFLSNFIHKSYRKYL